MADELDVKCPARGHLTRVTSIAAGRQARCQCGFTFLIPDAASADESDVPSRSTFDPSPEGAASGTERDGDPLLPEDIESLLDPDEVAWYSEQPPVKAVFVRISTRLLAIGAPLMVFFLVAAVAENGGGICLGITGLGCWGVRWSRCISAGRCGFTPSPTVGRWFAAGVWPVESACCLMTVL